MLDGVVQSLIRMDQDGFACDALMSQSQSLRQLPISELIGRQIKTRTASRPALFEIPHQH
jgi:hypothetical protein